MFFFFFFKQKTAYEMRISDWSSDVCSSDLLVVSDIFAVNSDNDVTGPDARICCRPSRLDRLNKLTAVVRNAKRICEILANRLDGHTQVEIGRASCRERVCQYV